MGLPSHRLELLTVREVMAELRLSRKTVDKLLHTGALPHLRVSGNAIRIHREDLERFIRRAKE